MTVNVGREMILQSLIDCPSFRCVTYYCDIYFYHREDMIDDL
jgi:hypothetical protein